MSIPRSTRSPAEWPMLVLAAVLVGAICIPLYQLSAAGGTASPSTLDGPRLARMLLGFEQIACYACFAWAIFLLSYRYREVRRQRRAFAMEILPRDESLRILPEDARPLQRRISQLSERGGPYLLSNILHLALGRFALSRSPQDAADTVRTQSDVELGRFASSMSTVNYLVWAIPAIGFLGTVRGIGLALTIAPDLADTKLRDFLMATSQHLAVAFDTTLVALMLSLILMFLVHTIQRAEETLVLDAQQYALEQLIHRLYEPKHAPGPGIGESSAAEFTLENAWPSG